MRRFIVALALLSVVLLLCSLPASAADMAVKQVGQYGGACKAIAVDGNKIYMGQGPRIVVFDISTPASPVVIGKSAPLPGIVNDIAVSGSYAYVADNTGGLQVVDTSDPANPATVGQFTACKATLGVAVSGDYVYLADNGVGLLIIDVSDPTNPTSVGAASSSSMYDVAVSGSYAYVATGNSTFIYDVSNPTSPRKVGTASRGGTYVTTYSHYACVSGNGGFTIIDIANPASPVISSNTGVFMKGVAVAGNVVYASSLSSGLTAMDISDPKYPRTSCVYSEAGYQPWCVAVSGDYIYTPNTLGGLYVMKATNADPYMGVYDTPGNAIDVAVSGNFAYVVDYGSSLQIFDVTNPKAAIKKGTYNTSGTSYAVAVSGNYAYVTDGSYGLQVIDISNPTAPIKVGGYDTSGEACDVAISGNYAYVTVDYSVQVIDISDPTNPVRVGECMGCGGGRIALSGSYAYVTDIDMVTVLDISNPANPIIKGYYYGNPCGIAVSGNNVCFADYDYLRILNVSNPAKPLLAGSYRIPGAQEMDASGNLVYVISSSNLSIVDVSNPSLPAAMGSLQLRIGAAGIKVSGQYAYVACGAYGLQILRVNELPKITKIGVCSDSFGMTYSVAVDGSHAYAAVGKGLAVMDVTNPSNISMLVNNQPQFQSQNYDIALSGSYTYVTGPTTVYAVDISDPFNPTKLGEYGFSTNNITISGNYAYLGSQGLQILNISNPASMVKIGSCNTVSGALCYQLALCDRYAYIASGASGLFIVDCLNPALPVVAKTYSTQCYYGIAISDSYAYATDRVDGLVVLNISNPLSPVRVGSCRTMALTTTGRISVSGGYAYVALGASGFQVFDVSNPAKPVSLGWIDTPGDTTRVTISGNYAYVSDQDGGLAVYSIGYDTLSACKSARDGAPAMVGGAVVTASFAGHFYIESLNRTSGIRVDRTGYTAEKGSLVSVEGTLSTNADGERFISALADPVKAGTGEVKPLYVRCDLMGGGAFGAFPGADEGVGLNNTGILIRTCGRVVEMEPVEAPDKPKWFKISDGSKSIIKCIATEGVTIDPSWAGVTVTGISSCEKADGKVVPVVRVRNLEDIASF